MNREQPYFSIIAIALRSKADTKGTTLEFELNQEEILTADANRSLFKIYLVEKGQGPRLYVGHCIFNATDMVIRSTWTS